MNEKEVNSTRNMGKDHDLIQAVKEQDTASLQKLLQKVGKLSSKNKIIGNNKKFNINFQDGDGMSALHQAALMGNTSVINMLLDNGASAELRDNKGMVPLHYATWQGKAEPVHVLLQKGSPVNLQAQNGESPLHLACQHGHFDVVNLLLLHHADPMIANKETKTPLDLACEFGRYRVVELLLRNNLCQKLLEDNHKDFMDNSQTTCLHLAARNGHSDILTLLLQTGMNINRATLKGTCLHEAALYGKTEVVKLLLDCGIDVNKPNSYDQTALDIVNKFTTNRAAKELKQLLKEASFACQARAIKNYSGVYDPHSLDLKEGDIITVLEQRPDGIWKGYVVQGGRMAKTGYFPANHVVLVDSQAIGKHDSTRKVNMPQVPDLLNRSPGYSSNDQGSFGSVGADESFPPPPSPLNMARSPTRETTDTSFCSPPPLYPGTNHQYLGVGKVVVNHTGDHADWPSSHTVGGDMRASSPCKDSPANSNRNSAASSDSGRGISTGHLEPKVHNLVNVQVTNQHRLSGQSYESGVSSRQSYHSTSSSSLGSLDRLEESGYTSTINVAELFQAGVPDHEVLHAWLRELRFEEYYNNFAQAGYDMPTISRMTPEDLTAIGITKPAHRKRLKAEIARLNIHDGIPDFKPNDLLEWLHLLGLGQYYETLTQQSYDNIDYVTDITWEDLEEIGIQRLGHQKKIMLAIDRLKRIMSGAKRLSSLDKRRGSQELLEPPPPANSTRWSGEMPPQHYQDLGVGAKPKKSPSGDSIATNSSGGSGGSAGSGEVRVLPQCRESEVYFGRHNSSSSGNYQPDVVAIQVKRSTSRVSTSETIPEGKDMAGQPISYQSFQGPANRKSSETAADKDYAGGLVFVEQDHGEKTSVTVAPIAPKVQVKPKPVAKIIAKTKRSSREYSPDNIEVEKHESECNSDGNKSPAPVGTIIFSSGTLKNSQHIRINQQEHIYDQPHIGPPPKAPKPKPLVLPKMTSSNQSYSPGPSSPLFISTQCQDAGPQTPSPTGRSKKAPPPPPKRTHSIRNDGTPHKEEVQVQVTKSTVQNLQSNVGECQEMPRPPPQTNALAPNTPANSKQQEIAPQQQAFASCVKSLSDRFGKGREENGAQENTSSDGEEFPPPPPPIAMDIITPKIHNYGIPSKMTKSGGTEYGGLQSKVKRDVGHSPSDKPRITNLSDKGRVNASDKSERTFGVQLRKRMSPPKEMHSTNSHDRPSEIDMLKSNLSEKRSDSTSSFESTCSSSSVDSNTLPFANENVGTIKQRTPAAKPSIVESFDGIDGEKSMDLNVGLFEENSNTIQRTPAGFTQSAMGMNMMASHIRPNVMASSANYSGMSRMSSGVIASKTEPSAAQKGIVRPPLPGKKPTIAMVKSQPVVDLDDSELSQLKRSTETGDVLCDIDNMLQDLTEELDAMLEEEVVP